MRNILFTLLLVVLSSMARAQSIKGDMDGDGRITMRDANEVVNTYLGKSAIQYLANGTPMYEVDNSPIAGTWYKSASTYMVLSSDGVINDNSRTHVVKFEFLPAISKLLTYDVDGNPDRYYDVLKFDDKQLVLGRNGDFERYTHEKPTEDDLPQNIISSEISTIDVQSILMSAYVKFSSFMEYELLMEDMALGKNAQTFTYSITPQNSIISNAFTQGYSIINICNMIIQRTSDSNAVAHATSIRSIVYYMMAQLWGDLPYMLKYVDSDTGDYIPATTSKEEIVADCIMYLSKSINSLENKTNSNGILDRNTALALLMEMKLSNGTYNGEYSESDIKSRTYDLILYKGNQALYKIVDNNYVDMLIEESNLNSSVVSRAYSAASQLAEKWKTAGTRYGVWNAMKRLHTATAVNGMSDCMKFPYPHQEIKMNPKLTQNPGY